MPAPKFRYTVSELANNMFLVRDEYDGTMRIMSRGEVDYLLFGADSSVHFARLGKAAGTD